MPVAPVWTTWAELSKDEFFDIATLRSEVFFVEQRIDERDLDDTDRDPSTLHVWIPDGDGVAAYLRMVTLGEPQYGARRSFGRVAVRSSRRGEGLARQLVASVLERHGHEPLVIHAQSYVVGLYEDYGFEVVGEPFVEAGLHHRTMVRAGQ